MKHSIEYCFATNDRGQSRYMPCFLTSVFCGWRTYAPRSNTIRNQHLFTGKAKSRHAAHSTNRQPKASKAPFTKRLSAKRPYNRDLKTTKEQQVLLLLPSAITTR